MKRISVIIVNFNTNQQTLEAVRRLKWAEPDLDLEMIVIDNASEPAPSARDFANEGVRLIRNPENFGFAKAVNQGIRAATCDYVLLLNPDVLVTDGAISHLVTILDAYKQAAIVGPKMLYPDGRHQISTGRFPTLWREFLRLSALYKIINGSTLHSQKELNGHAVSVDWLSGGCLLFRRSLVGQIGPLDESYFLGVEDIDFCYRASQAGYKTIYEPLAMVHHHHGLSSGQGGTRSLARLRFDREGMLNFYCKHYGSGVGLWILGLMHDAKIALIRLTDFINSISPMQFIRFVKQRPFDATMAVTYRCNSRCRMCNIWRLENAPELSLAAIRNLSPDLKYLNLTGGEPFLRNDLPEIVRAVKEKAPRAQIIISTNGFLSEKILRTVPELLRLAPDLGVRVSIDGLGEAHDRVRGVPGAFAMALNTVRGLRNFGLKNLGLSFTLMDGNAADLPKVFDLSRRLGVEISIALVQNSDIYFAKADNSANDQAAIESALRYVIARQLSSWSPKDWGRAYVNYGLLKYAQEKERLLPSGAGFDSLFIDASGRVYPSNLIGLTMGDLKTEGLDRIWQGEAAQAVRQKIKSEGISESWIICTIRGEMKRKAHKVIWWIVKNQILSVVAICKIHYPRIYKSNYELTNYK